MLIVVAIIGILLALTAGTVWQVMAGQQQKNTQRLIGSSLAPNLDSHIRAVLDQSKELPIPQNVMNMANGDPRLAKVIWGKLQIKRNFPVTYAEALAPWAYTGNSQLPANVQLSPTDLPALEVFQKGLQGVPVATFGTNPQAEMAALLRLTLTVPRRGIKPFIAESELGPQAVADTNNDGVLEIVDYWGNPLAFFRFPTDNADMNSAIPAAQAASPFRDPQDPEGLLLNPTWNSKLNYFNNPPGGNYLFEQHVHRIHDPTAANWTPQAMFMLPTIVSSGRNERLGLILGPSPPPFYVPGPPTVGSPNFAMFVDPNDPKNPGSYNDDVISFTLR
jgi:hypothetical protein